jgi:hypothetical protein
MTRLLNRRETSGELKEKFGIDRKPATLAKLACIGGGPPFRRDGRRALYDPADLAQWAEALLTPPAASTAEHDARSGRRRPLHTGRERPPQVAQGEAAP